MQAVSDIINWAKISQYLATNAINRGGLWGDGIPANLPRHLYMVRKNVEWLYDLDPTDETLTATSSYLLTLCGKFGLQAMSITGNAGTIAGIAGGSGTIYPFVITSSDFEGDQVTYNNPEIVGDNLMLFVTGFNQEWQFAPTFFNYTATGFIVVWPGFQASDYGNIIVQQLNNG